MELIGIDIFTDEKVKLTIEKGLIVKREIVDSDDNLPFIAPGFIDIQVNGYRGLDYSSPSLKCEDVEKLIYFLAESGTVMHVPTIITNSQKLICQNLETIAQAVEKNETVKKAIVAIHMEGPYISAVDGPRGAHDKEFVRDPDIKELDQWLEASNGLLKFVTLAPEREGAVEFIKYAVSKNIIVSIGHSGATVEQIKAAVEAGATLSTHLGNGSHAQLPRLKNYLWEQLANDSLCSGIIADGYHLPDSVMKVIYRTKGKDKIVLVSDVALLGGSAVGRYKWGNINVEVHPDGHLSLADTPFLAGAGHLLDRGIPIFADAAQIDLAESVKLATINPARLLFNSDNSIGLKEGLKANIVQFRVKGKREPLVIEKTFLEGQQIFNKEGN
jgi:N-acetylglucosamine-6-phosphate deacetylase